MLLISNIKIDRFFRLSCWSSVGYANFPFGRGYRIGGDPVGYPLSCPVGRLGSSLRSYFGSWLGSKFGSGFGGNLGSDSVGNLGSNLGSNPVGSPVGHLGSNSLYRLIISLILITGASITNLKMVQNVQLFNLLCDKPHRYKFIVFLFYWGCFCLSGTSFFIIQKLPIFQFPQNLIISHFRY